MTENLLEHFDQQARTCVDYGSPFTGALIEHCAEDLRAGGPVADLVGDWPGSPRADALSLRLTGALHAAVLSGRDKNLARVYPTPHAPASGDAAWPAARAFLARERDWVAAFLRSPPQTNETRRSIGLLAGFLCFAKSFSGPIDTLELGASAGLNLNWDRFAYRTESWSWNDSGSVRIDTDWSGAPPPVDVVPHIRKRSACDQNPLDVSDPAQRLQLKAYIWPDQIDRLTRFDAAADLAIARGVAVQRADAAMWLNAKLNARADDAATIVYHSVFYQYPPRETRAAIRAAIESAGAEATARAPLAWLRFEPEGALGGPSESARFFVDMITWPGGARRVLVETDGHARWMRVLEDQPV